MINKLYIQWYQWFLTLEIDTRVQILATIATCIISIISVLIAVSTLIQTKKITFDANRANIVFFIEKNQNSSLYTLVLKNFGNSSGTIIDINTTPSLSYEKTRLKIQRKTIFDCKNIHLAPGQSIKTVFDFQKYPDRDFKVSIKYKTGNKLITESYDIDLNYRDSILSLSSPIPDNELKALMNINNSIQEVADKLL